MPTQQDIRQSVLRSALNMAGSAVNATVDGILIANDPLISKLFEDRNILLTDGGTITFTGTQVQFTENLNITVSQKISGAVPQVISLGSANQNFVSSGDMLVAVLNRTAGTATLSIVTAGSSLAAVANANQEVFLIAKRVDAGDGTQRLYWRNGFAQNAGQTLRLGQGGGSGSGIGGGSDLNSLQFRAAFIETFSEAATNSASAVNGTAAFTNATYSAAKQMYAINYDASKTANTTGTAVTMSGAPAYTVVAGDVLVNLATNEVKKITVVASQTSYTLESSFASNLAAGSVCVSQAVHTKDIYNYSGTGAAISAAFPGSTFSEILVDYEDNATSGSNLWTPDTAPFVAFVASTDNSNWTTLQTRTTNETDTMQSDVCPTAGSSLYLRFFSDKTSGSGFVNLLNYEAFMQKALASTAGGIVWSAYGTTNSSTTPINCSVSVVGGKTTITFTNQYAVGVNPGQTFGVLDVQVNGQALPRFVAGSVPATDGFYNEISANVIQLDSDYSGKALDFQVVLRTQVVDASTTNTTNISSIQAFVDVGFQGFIDSSSSMTATSTAGTPAAGTFYSSIVGRANIVDLSQDLKPRFGVERIMTQQIQQLQNESGPNGEAVYSVLNDTNGKIRFIGTWANTIDTNGARPGSSGTPNVDSVEITFYGTGLNILAVHDSAARTMSYSVDGGGLTTVTYPASGSTVLESHNYGMNQVLAVVNSLSLGIHTVRILMTGSVNQTIYGFEVLGQFSSGSNLVTVNPGIMYNQGIKSILSAQSTLAYNAAVSGTTGGRVVEYITAAGVRGQAFTQNASSPSFSAAASHTNEEVARVYSFREFGAGTATDFSSLVASLSARSFTLDDGTTTLVGTSVSASTVSGFEVLNQASGATVFFTFIGTGLDIVFPNSALVASVAANIDNAGANNIFSNPTSNQYTFKVASGLSYGTHTCAITYSSFTSGTGGIQKFIVYQPKTPAIPSGAIQVGSYNVMANFAVATPSANNQYISTGVLRKMIAARESVFTGTWGNYVVNTLQVSGLGTDSVVSGSTVSYTFFGTGAIFHTEYNAVAYNVTFSIDGSTNLTGLGTFAQSGSGLSLVASTGVLSGTSSGSNYAEVRITGLTLGLHTIKVTSNSTSPLFADAVDVITPVHSYKSNIYGDLQNTLPIGSNSVSDDRVFTPIQDSLPATKAWAQAIGIAVAPTTTSATLIPMPDMSVNIKTSGGAISLDARVVLNLSTQRGSIQIFMDGIAVGILANQDTSAAGDNFMLNSAVIVPANAGTHKIDIYWQVNGGTTLTANGTNRILTAREL